jgi:DNA-binding CsgD family transcriptional regulator
VVAGGRLDDHPGPVVGERVADVARRADRVTHVVERVEEALCHHAHTPDVFETARTNLAYGARLRRARRRVDARERLQDANQAFARLGAQRWVETAADELAATGITVAPRGATGLDLLTPRERQIVQLLVDGRTTREAAGALFLSPKTVEYHLRHVYTKLGITNRRELTDLVGSGG